MFTLLTKDGDLKDLQKQWIINERKKRKAYRKLKKQGLNTHLVKYMVDKKVSFKGCYSDEGWIDFDNLHQLINFARADDRIENDICAAVEMGCIKDFEIWEKNRWGTNKYKDMYEDACSIKRRFDFWEYVD